ncbi:YjaG family protein [Ferrimonas lipolytica]|uniref:YjaG family protein n=1 Tax=Ferrimonas lipolytica TaxID=2724191 RepID=A0A6H1U950_9GAMM|nr:YjaG family protein [Ferrimonas lipolytica]QIZ75554.1 YjaG family protein [Ferrimonas lipolytica]
MTAKNGFFNRIKALDTWQKTLFAAALTERMLPNYQLFAQITEQENGDKPGIALDLLWQSLHDRKFKMNYERLINQMDELVPAEDEHDFYGVYPATDLLTSLSTIFTALQQKIETDLVNISKLSSSTVAAFIEASEQPEVKTEEALDDFIFQHELMAQERDIQEQLLEFVEQQNGVWPDAIKGLRKELRDLGVSNIGISLDD